VRPAIGPSGVEVDVYQQKRVTLVQHTFIRNPDSDVVFKSDAPVSDARIPPVAPSMRHIGGDKIVETQCELLPLVIGGEF
jgi:hypothetical protein